jgi:hypothetical protein
MDSKILIPLLIAMNVAFIACMVKLIIILYKHKKWRESEVDKILNP